MYDLKDKEDKRSRQKIDIFYNNIFLTLCVSYLRSAFHILKDAFREVMKTQQASKYMHRYFSNAPHSGFQIKSQIKI